MGKSRVLGNPMQEARGKQASSDGFAARIAYPRLGSKEPASIHLKEKVEFRALLWSDLLFGNTSRFYSNSLYMAYIRMSRIPGFVLAKVMS